MKEYHLKVEIAQRATERSRAWQAYLYAPRCSVSSRSFTSVFQQIESRGSLYALRRGWVPSQQVISKDSLNL